MKPLLKLVLVTVIALSCVACAPLGDFLESGTSEDLQHDLDIARLKDLEALSGYIEQYHEATGKYPLQGEVDFQHYVYIATQEQQQYVRGSPPYTHKTSPATRFVRELTDVLGADLVIPFDPQRYPVNKPNFYIYMVAGDTYFLAVHLHNDFAFTQKVADYYYKVEVTNAPEAVRQGLWLRNELLANPDYVDAATAAPFKPGYVEQVRSSLGGNAAF